jgi:hypothetical protein
MPGFPVSLGVALLAVGASYALGVALRRRSVGVALSLLLGLVAALFRLLYEPDQPAASAFIAFPLACLVLNSLGVLARERKRLRQTPVTNPDAEPGTESRLEHAAQGEVPVPQAKSRPGSWGEVPLTLLGGLATGVATWLFSGDWACSAFSAALLGALATAAINVSGRIRARNKWRRPQQLVVVLIVAASLTILMSLIATDAAMFEGAFAIAPPEGVADIRARAYYAGGPGDRIVLVRFQADEPTIDRIISARRLSPAKEDLENYLQGTRSWEQFLRNAMGYAGSFDPAWRRIPEMAEPRLYEWSSDLEHLKLLWDAETGQAYAVYTFG